MHRLEILQRLLYNKIDFEYPQFYYDNKECRR